MFLKPLLAKNPKFVAAAIKLHRAGAIPANSYVIDLDTVAANTRSLMDEARAQQLTVYAMTKQIGRAPGALDVVTAAGIDGYVAVDMDCARPITNNGHNLGHLGHLVQIPFAEAAEAATMQPDYWTVFSHNKATEASKAAEQSGRIQNLLVRVFDPNDEFYTGHEGGVTIEELPKMIDHIGKLPGARFAGVTTFPALLFDAGNASTRTTSNVMTLARAVEIAQRHLGSGYGSLEVNAPGTTSTAVLGQLNDIGATQVEPGHGLTGTTPLHAVTDLPEQPAVLYLSEVAHIHQGTPFCFGGGLYIDPVFGRYNTTALVAHDPSEISTAPIGVDIPDPAAIDYYAKLHPSKARTFQEGATVIFGFRIQAFVTRALVTCVTGAATSTPSVTGVWDAKGNPTSWRPVQ
ncbi:MAG: alanine racemase [Acidimicrobiaceae bacterium]|nr:alanine racemase [Acidimicrobiaceae bacterium]